MAILLADIGGTKARFRWLKKGKICKLYEYRCDDFALPEDVIDQFLKDSPTLLDGIVLACAGPLQKGSVHWTNRPRWKVSKKFLCKKYQLKNVLLLNDVQAQGEGLKALYHLQQTSILMTAGTGLGGCFILNGQVIPTEIGQIKMEEGLKTEDFISGLGIVRLYHYLGGDKKINSARLIDELRFKKDKIAQKTYQQFYQKWGQFSAQIATALCASGGIYLWGGLLPKNEKDKKTLIKSYQENLPESFSDIPLYFVKEETLAFKGLALLSKKEFSQSLK